MKFWVGIIPPKKISKELYRTQKEIAKKYKTYHGLENEIGPHITITCQGNVSSKHLRNIEKVVKEISERIEPLEIRIDGLGRFYKKRVIYAKVVKSKKLNKLHNLMSSKLRNFDKIRILRIYTPHITLAYEDISEKNFKKAFKEFNKKRFSFKFNMNRVYIGKSKSYERIKVYKSFKV